MKCIILAIAFSFPAISCVEHGRYKRDNEDKKTNENQAIVNSCVKHGRYKSDNENKKTNENLAIVVCGKQNLGYFEACGGFNCLCEAGTYLKSVVNPFEHYPDERNCSNCTFDSGDPDNQFFMDYQNNESSCFKSHGAKYCDSFMNTHRVEGSTENSRCECNPCYHSANKTGDVKAGCHKYSPCDVENGLGTGGIAGIGIREYYPIILAILILAILILAILILAILIYCYEKKKCCFNNPASDAPGNQDERNGGASSRPPENEAGYKETAV